MEAATTDNLERLIARADKYPQLRTHMRDHLEVSRRQKDELEEQLKALGSDTSTLKDMAMRLAGRLEPLLSGVTADDMPTHCIAAHSWEQFEIAAYRSMLGAAEELGHDWPTARANRRQRFSNSGAHPAHDRRMCYRQARSAIISTKSRRVSLNRRYHAHAQGSGANSGVRSATLPC